MEKIDISKIEVMLKVLEKVKFSDLTVAELLEVNSQLQSFGREVAKLKSFNKEEEKE